MNNDIRMKIAAHFRKSPIKKYAKGKIITFAGEAPSGVSLLISGVVEQYDITPEGNKIVVNLFKPGAFFPMSWAINKTQNTYFYSALTDAELKQADADKTVSFLRENEEVMFDLLSRVYRGTDALLRRLAIASSGLASSRLIFELLIEAYRFGNEVSEDKRTIKITQNVLAARSGLARETISRELQKLKNDGLLSTEKEGIVINTKLLEKKLNIEL